MITQDEYIALAQQKYQQLAALQEKTTFYDHEKEFETIWRDLGQLRLWIKTLKNQKAETNNVTLIV